MPKTYFDNHSTHIALKSRDHSLTYKQMWQNVQQRAQWLGDMQVQTLAIAMDNHIEWVLFDLACQQQHICCVPVPSFFTPLQMQHLLRESGCQLVVGHESDHNDFFTAPVEAPAQLSPFEQVLFRRLSPEVTCAMPDKTAKVTFTSGSTSTPKGVCLSTHSQWQQAQVLADTVNLPGATHLCLLPLSTLLENIAGVYAPLISHGTLVLASEQDRGFRGSRLDKLPALLALISQIEPDSLVLVPELLTALLAGIQQGWTPPESLKFIAVGGSRVSDTLLKQATELGLPVYEGYGLSECVSVVSLNTPSDNQSGTAGRLLQGREINTESGEAVISGNLFLGYINQPDSWYPQQVFTGDRITLAQQRLIIQGRVDNLIINTFGRNISPEWIELEVLASGLFLQCVVFGHSRPFCVALLYPRNPSLSDKEIQTEINRVNQTLPDYGQLQGWFRPATALSSRQGILSSHEGTLTDNQRPRRHVIQQQFDREIQSLYLSH